MSTEPCAAMTAGDVKFSDAISWIVVFCRSISRRMMSAIAGSDSSSRRASRGSLIGSVYEPSAPGALPAEAADPDAGDAMLVVVEDVLPRVTPSALRDVEQRCPRQVALDYTDDGFSDPVNRGRLRDAFLDAARAAHGSGGLPRSDAFRPPDALEPEEQRVFEHAARWYLALYGDRPVTLHLHDCDRPTERGGIRVGGWVDLTVEHEDGTKELRQIDLWRSRAPREDPMELESVWMAVLRLRPWVGDGSLVVSWADLVGGARCERVVQLGDELEPLRERFEARLAALRTRADPLRPIPGGGCARCNHLVRCPAHPGALPVRTPRGDSKTGRLPSDADVVRHVDALSTRLVAGHALGPRQRRHRASRTTASSSTTSCGSSTSRARATTPPTSPTCSTRTARRTACATRCHVTSNGARRPPRRSGTSSTWRSSSPCAPRCTPSS